MNAVTSQENSVLSGAGLDECRLFIHDRMDALHDVVAMLEMMVAAGYDDETAEGIRTARVASVIIEKVDKVITELDDFCIHRLSIQ